MQKLQVIFEALSWAQYTSIFYIFASPWVFKLAFIVYRLFTHEWKWVSVSQCDYFFRGSQQHINAVKYLSMSVKLVEHVPITLLLTSSHTQPRKVLPPAPCTTCINWDSYEAFESAPYPSCNNWAFFDSHEAFESALYPSCIDWAFFDSHEAFESAPYPSCIDWAFFDSHETFESAPHSTCIY